MRAVNGLVASGGPTGPLHQTGGVILRADDNFTAGGLGLKMTLEAKIGAPLDKHLVIDRAVWIVASGAAFANRFVFEYERTALRHVALHACFALGHDRSSAPFDGRAAVRIMAVAAGNLSIFDRVMMRRCERGLLVQVALEAGF